MFDRDLLLCGAGKMGGALLNGWLLNGLDKKKINVFEPNPSEWLKSLANSGLKLNKKLQNKPGVCVIAVKPQMVYELFSKYNFADSTNTLFVSIVAGIKLQKFEQLLNNDVAIIRVMPNTPASINKGVSCIIANKSANEEQIRIVETLFAVVGHTIRLVNETEMDAVTAISGSGPAYVFHLIEAMAKAGVELGLDSKLAQRLAVLTVSGSGLLAEISEAGVSELRSNVTSPNGTTEAALNVLMNSDRGLVSLIREAAFAACARSKEIGFLKT